MFDRFRRRYHERVHKGVTIHHVEGGLEHWCVCGTMLGTTTIAVDPKLANKPKPEGSVVPFRRRA